MRRESICPRCKSTQVSRSRRRNPLDALMSLFHLKPMRCKECRKRFYVTVPPDYPEKRRKQRKSPAEQADRVAADQRAA